MARASIALLLGLALPGCLYTNDDKRQESEEGTVDGVDGADLDRDADDDGYDEDVDCDDADPLVYPDAEERCDSVDNDCDGLVDEEGAVDAPGWYYDADGDGYGDLDDVTYACTQPPAHVDDPRDCDDSRAEISPGAQEVCDGQDNDCDDLVDADDDSLGGDTATWYTDGDGDGHGDDATEQIACTQPAGTVATGGDCDDRNPTIHPFRAELCDGIDQDCDGLVDDDPVDDGETYWPDADGDDWGDDGAGMRACTPPEGMISRGGDCDDGRAEVNPGAAEVCEDGLDNDCDGTAAGCLVEGDLLLSSDFDLRVRGEGAFDYAGGRVALLDDVTGDGVPDLAIGAPGDDEGATGAGAVYLVRATRTGTHSLSTAQAKVLGQNSSDQLGRGIAAAGDLDGDGVGDLLVGTRYNDAGGEDKGAAYVVFGPISGTVDLDDYDLKVVGTSSTDYAGTDVARAGDTDGDGVVELLVGAPGQDAGGANSGAAYLVPADELGGNSLGVASARLVGDDAGDLAGDAVWGGEDLDGDGLDDVIVGGRQSDLGGLASGAAWVLLGPVTGGIDLSDADLVLAGEAANDAAGTAVALTGDLTGDGLADVVVGATGNDAGGTGAGAAYVFAGGRTGEASLAAADATLLGRVGSENLGGWACPAGDTDGDGAADLLVGAEGHNGGRGAVYLYAGPLTGTIAGIDATARIRGEASGDRAGTCGGAVDIDGDGLSEILIGADGNAAAANYAGAAWLLRPEAL